MFIRNCWYVIAWEHEVPADGLFTRKVLGEPILLLRTAAGAVVALEDRCCHRLAPLSTGQREGDCVRCGYHGLKFDTQGQCVEVPGMASVPAHLKVRTYPVQVKNRWVFVWLGDAARADPALLPDNFSNAHPEWANVPDYLHYNVPYLLICDNLLDFSHLSYVHARTLGGTPAIARARPTIEKTLYTDGSQSGIKVSRHVPDVPPSPFWKSFLPGIAGQFNRWFIYDFLLPGTLLMHSGGRPVGAAADDDSQAVHLHSCQTLTPETETSTHYFFQQSCRASYLEAAPNTAALLHLALLQAFEEDRAMITAQWRNLATDPTRAMAALPFDAALGQFRALVERRVKAEAV